MKKKIFLLFAALAIVFANVEVRPAYCPPGYDLSPWYYTYFNGCKIGYQFCYGIDENELHGFSLKQIIIYPPCNQSVYENNKEALTNKILLEIPLTYESASLFQDNPTDPPNPNYIPECPNNTLCFLRVDDAFCYNGWEARPFNSYPKPRPLPPDPGYGTDVTAMKICDDGKLRTCYNAIYYCWEEDEHGEPVLRMYKNGYQQGDPCPYPCQWSCE
jgi:hypothetical protein